MNKKSIIMMAVGVSILVGAPFAYANAELEIFVGNTLIESSGIQNGSSGSISIPSFSADGWTVSLANGIWNPSGTIPTLDLGTFSVAQSGSGTLTILFGANNNPSLGSPAVLTSSSIVNGNLTGTVSGYWGPNNDLLAIGVPSDGLLLSTVPLSGGTASAAFIATGPYSLTEELQIFGGGPGSSSADDELSVSGVPDAGETLGMLTLGCAGLRALRRRFNQQA